MATLTPSTNTGNIISNEYSGDDDHTDDRVASPCPNNTPPFENVPQYPRDVLEEWLAPPPSIFRQVDSITSPFESVCGGSLDNTFPTSNNHYNNNSSFLRVIPEEASTTTRPRPPALQTVVLSDLTESVHNVVTPLSLGSGAMDENNNHKNNDSPIVNMLSLLQLDWNDLRVQTDAALGPADDCCVSSSSPPPSPLSPDAEPSHHIRIRGTFNPVLDSCIAVMERGVASARTQRTLVSNKTVSVHCSNLQKNGVPLQQYLNMLQDVQFLFSDVQSKKLNNVYLIDAPLLFKGLFMLWQYTHVQSSKFQFIGADHHPPMEDGFDDVPEIVAATSDDDTADSPIAAEPTNRSPVKVQASKLLMQGGLLADGFLSERCVI